MNAPTTKPAIERVNVLLVDDQPSKLLVYETILADLDVNLIKANSAREALDHLLRNEIALVLMDVSMPDVDGFELASIIHQHPRYQRTAIIFVSAVHLSDIDRIRGYESGAVDYVFVPVIPELLRAKVNIFAELYRKTRESERLTRELEQRVLDRTAEVEASAEAQVRLAEQLLQADKRKDEFLALLAHELRNPLAPMRNALSIMHLKGSDDPELAWCRDVIERQTNQLTRLVDDLLDVSRITQGKIKLRHEKVDLGAIISAATEACRPLVDALGHTLNMRVPDVPAYVNGDAVRLIQVVSNLLNNAAKYQSEGGRIDVAVAVDLGVGSITVRDYGPGIDPEVASHVFELFWQGERGNDRAQGGLGIGLSVVRTLVEMHGGSVRVLSGMNGAGTTFEVRLPLVAEESSSLGDNIDRTVTWTETGPPRRILVVDDNEDSADSMAMLLRMRGHEVMVAHESRKALEIAATAWPSVVMLDIGLPEMDGYEVCRRLRKQGMVEAQIIAMTGYGQERDQQQSLAAGFDAHTVKPVDIGEVLKLMDSRR